MMLRYETAVTYLDAYENEYPVDILLTYKKKWLEQYINKIVRLLFKQQTSFEWHDIWNVEWFIISECRLIDDPCLLSSKVGINVYYFKTDKF